MQEVEILPADAYPWRGEGEPVNLGEPYKERPFFVHVGRVPENFPFTIILESSGSPQGPWTEFLRFQPNQLKQRAAPPHSYVRATWHTQSALAGRPLELNVTCGPAKGT